MAPASDEEIHAHQGQIEEDVEQQQVQGQEYAQGSGFQEQHPGVVLTRRTAGIHRVGNGRGKQQSTHNGNRQGNAIKAQAEAHAQRRHPADFLHQLEHRAVGIELNPGHQHQDQGHHGDGHRPEAGERFGKARPQRQD